MATEDKLDFVYNELKAQKRNRIFNMCLKITVFGFFIFLYFTYIHWMSKQELTREASKILWEMIKPIAKDLATDIVKNSEQNVKNVSEWLIEWMKK